MFVPREPFGGNEKNPPPRPPSCASLKSLLSHSEEDGRNVMERCVEGFDGGITEKIMRSVCGLPYVPRLCTSTPPAPATPIPVATVPVGAPSTPVSDAISATPVPAAVYRPDCRLPRTPRSRFFESEMVVVMRAHGELLHHCMFHQLELLNKQMIGRVSVWSSCKGPTAQAALFGKLVCHGFWKELPKRKQWAAPHVPVIATRHRFELGPFPEVFRVSHAVEYVTNERTNHNNTKTGKMDPGGRARSRRLPSRGVRSGHAWQAT